MLTEPGETEEDREGMAETAWPEKYERILRPYLPLLSPEAPLDPEAGLDELGLDSLGTVAVLVELEEAFSASIPDDLVDGDTFSSPASLWAALRPSDRSPA